MYFPSRFKVDLYDVSECLQQGIRVQDLLFDAVLSNQVLPLVQHVLVHFRHKVSVRFGQIAQNDLSRLGLTRPALPRYYNALVLIIDEHVLV